MAESTVWLVMHPDGSRTVVGDYMLALAYAKGDHCGDAAFRPSPPRPVSAARAAS